MPNHPVISADELAERLTQGKPAALVDVRTPEEYRTVHAKDAILLPLNQFSRETLEKALREHGKASEPVYMLCASGKRASQACEQALAEGFDNVTLVQGGTLAWAQGGHPVEHGDND